METKSPYFIVGIFVILSVMGLGLFMSYLTQEHNTKDYESILVVFPGAVNGLSQGSSVRYNGVQVGRVTDIRIDSKNTEQVKVTIEILKTTPINTTTRAKLEMLGITGLTYVTLSTPRTEEEVILTPAEKKHLVIYAQPSSLERMIVKFPDMIEHITAVATRVETALNEHNLEALDEILGNMQIVSDNLALMQPQIRSLVDSLHGTLESTATFAGPLLQESYYLMRDLRQSAAGITDLTRSLKENPSQLLYQPQPLKAGE